MYYHRLARGLAQWLWAVLQAHPTASSTLAVSVALGIAVWAYRINRDWRPYTP